MDDEEEMNDVEGPRCLLSHPSHPPHNLSVRADPIIPLGCFTCGGKYAVRPQDHFHYHCHCTTCGVDFHNGCHQRPRRITHPYHLQHPLTLFYRNPETEIISNIIPDCNPCNPSTWDKDSDTSDQEFVDTIPSESDIVFEKCTWCGNDFRGSDWFYRCLICSFCLDLPCAEIIPPLVIPNPKSHHHSLLFLPRPLLVPCDACGLVDASEPSYACFQCNYMVHRNCIDLPRVIKITRHQHRLSHIPYRSPLISSCRVCYKEVDFKYGQYSCNHQDCSYVVHSKCATHVNVWDGMELEWEPEDSDETEDVASFRKLGDGLIRHFFHGHPLRLKKHNGVGDTDKQCEACVFPILSQQFYHCEECNYSLHEVCAGLSRKLDHALHNHTLILYPTSSRESISCSACFRTTTGFIYACSKEGCHISLDVQCILVPECFIHKSHQHSIFISTSYNNKNEILCKVCKKRCLGSHLQCTECEFTLCYACGTIPNEIHYRFDKHPLTLSFGESADNIYWCEVCEKRLDPTEWFYTCNECCTIVHLQCIFGSSYFVKPGTGFFQLGGKVKVIRNSSNTRLFCFECNKRCTGYVYYEGYWWSTDWSSNSIRPESNVFCSYECKEPGMKKTYLRRYG